MDQFFYDSQQPQQQLQAPSSNYTPPTFQSQPAPVFNIQYPNNQFEYAYEQPAYEQPQQTFDYQPQVENQNDFNDFEEDETAKRIREEEQRIQNLLREKSREWEEKQKRKDEGRRQLEEFLAKKEDQKVERAKENIRKESDSKEEYAKLNVEAGWKKVITNINVRQGERKGAKDTNRMREAILHRREDDKR